MVMAAVMCALLLLLAALFGHVADKLFGQDLSRPFGRGEIVRDRSWTDTYSRILVDLRSYICIQKMFYVTSTLRTLLQSLTHSSLVMSSGGNGKIQEQNRPEKARRDISRFNKIVVAWY